MAKETYNTGRVVGWSTYEEFLKQNPDIDPSIVTALVYQTMVTYGAASLVDLPINRESWSGDVLLTQTVAVPGAIWGVTPIVGLNYTAYQQNNTVPDKGKIERGISNIFSCYVSDQNGKNASNATSETGYITFCAYPEILECGLSSIPLLIRGLGAEAITSGNGYFGPEGLVFAGNGFGAKGASSNYLRCLPKTDPEKYVDMDPVIDMRTTDPKTFYQTYYKDAPVDLIVKSIQPLNSEAGILSIYQQANFLAPALYGTKLQAGANKEDSIYPLDIVAPGTLKVFHNGSIDDIVNFEDALKPNKNMCWVRDPVTYVVYESNEVHQQVPISDDKYVPLFSNLYSSEVLPPSFCIQSNTGDPHDSLNIVGCRRLHGYLGTNFLETYSFSSSELSNILKTGTYGVSDWSGVDRENYKNALDYIKENPSVRYRYLLVTTERSGAAWYWQVIPIRIEKSSKGKDIGYIDYIGKFYYAPCPEEWSKDSEDYASSGGTPPTGWEEHPFVPLPRENNKIDKLEENHNLLGTWWSGYSPINTTLDYSAMKSAWSDLRSTASEVVDEFLPEVTGLKVINTPGRYLPATTYNQKSYTNYVEMYKAVTIKTVASLGGNKNLLKWLHPSLHNSTLYQIMEKSRLWKITPNNESELTPYTTQFNGKDIHGNRLQLSIVSRSGYNSSLIKAKTIEGYGTPSSNKILYNLNDKYDWSSSIPLDELTDNDFVVDFSTFTDKNCLLLDIILMESNVNQTVLVDLPEECMVEDGPRASRGISGNNTTLSLAVAHSDNSPCNFLGTDGVIDCLVEGPNGMLTWDILARALDEGKAIDVLGDQLRQIRDSFLSVSLKPTGNNPYYTGLQLDVFGYTSSGPLKTVVTYATLTRISSHRSVNSQSWYQTFEVDPVSLAHLVALLRRNSNFFSESANTLKMLITPHTSYRSTESKDSSGNSIVVANNGAPSNPVPAPVTCYIGLTGDSEGKGIMYCLNNGSIDVVATSSNLCTLALSQEIGLIDYKLNSLGGNTWS